MAPDSSSASNGKKLAQARLWPLLGRSERALWGECQGSGSKPYQVRVDLGDFASKCSCPSFKFPCKHALGLLMLTAGQPELVKPATEPDWLTAWLDKRSETQEKKEARAQAKAAAPVDEAAQRKRAERRDNRVQDGLAALQVWLEDLVRNGLARLPGEGPAIWEQQAARLVDAQAPGLAARLRALADLPGRTGDWPQQLLEELGRLSLAVRAYERIDQLAPALQQVVRQYIGFTVREDEVLVSGEAVRDRWQVIGQTRRDDERVRVQRTWLMGQASGRAALLLQFAVGNQPFEAAWLPGSAFEAELVFWPGAHNLRAVLRSKAEPAPAPQAFWGACGVTELLARHAAALASQPWVDSLPVVLREVVPVCQPSGWRVADAAGQALPVAGADHWLWLSLSGGHPLDLAAEWDGQVLHPLGVFASSRYYALTRGA
jgi:hypothetical protein